MHLDQVLGRKATVCEQAWRAGLGVQRLCSGSLGAAAGGMSTCGPGAGCAAPGAITAKLYSRPQPYQPVQTHRGQPQASPGARPQPACS